MVDAGSTVVEVERLLVLSLPFRGKDKLVRLACVWSAPALPPKVTSSVCEEQEGTGEKQRTADYRFSFCVVFSRTFCRRNSWMLG